MTDNPQIDPRLLAARRFLDEYAAALSRTSPGPMSHAARMLELLDAADEASGVRRVTAAEDRQRVREAVSSVPFQPESEPPNVRQHSYWMGWMDCYAAIVNALGIAADSPVGGVS